MEISQMLVKAKDDVECLSRQSMPRKHLKQPSAKEDPNSYYHLDIIQLLTASTTALGIFS